MSKNKPFQITKLSSPFPVISLPGTRQTHGQEPHPCKVVRGLDPHSMKQIVADAGGLHRPAGSPRLRGENTAKPVLADYSC